VAPAGHQIFLDPHMATGQTSKASVAALLEALFYAVEACLYDGSGLTEQSLLVGAVEAVWTTLKKIYENPANAEYRLLATQAGFDISMACALGPRGTGVTFEYKGEAEIAGRRLARYDYRVSEMWGGQSFNLPEGTGTAGLHGSLWADPRTYDVIRLEMDADNFPPALPLVEAITRVDYARTVFDDGVSLLLPASGEFRMAKVSGETSLNRIEFTDCRLFQARSEIDFDEPGSPAAPALAAAAPSTNENRLTLRAGLRIDVKLRSRISGNLAVGGLIEGAVASAVRVDAATLIAAGSPVHGRIRRLERRTDPKPYFIVALEFTEVESHGIRYRFFADLLELGTAPGLERELSFSSTESRSLPGGPGARIEKRKWDDTWLPVLPGVASFFVRGAELNLQPGFHTVWTTRSVTP